MRRIHAVLAACAAAALAACTGLPPAPVPTNPIRFLAINDVYVLDTLGDGRGGIARVAALRTRLAAEGPTIFTLAGDFLSPSLLTKYHRGAQMVEALNAAGLDYATFGNHEFELRRDTLVARIAASKFTWLSANCTEAEGRPFPGVQAWDTVTHAGRKVGIFGLTMPGSYPSWVRCSDPDSAARRMADTLGALGAELIVALTHQPVEADGALLQREPRVDLVLGGHEHDAHEVRLGDRYVLKADANSRTAQFATVWGDTTAWRLATALVPIDERVPMDTAVRAVVARWQDSLRARLGPERVVGTAAEPIDGRDGLQRSREAPLGMLVADAIRAGTGADVGLINAGSLRLDDVVPAGPISNYTLESIFLFADEARVLTFPLTGARLREILEHGVSAENIGSGGFLQVSGVRFAYDSTRADGDRIVGALTRPDGAVIAPAETLTVSFPVYPVCEGGDGYAVPEGRPACERVGEAPRTVDLLIRHVEGALGGKVSPPAGGRVTAR
jgi:5'-nucleotidase